MPRTQESNCYIGLSGLKLPVPKYLFPQEHLQSSRLTYYASFFNSIEINSTFYKLPKATTVLKWAEEVPDNFMFTFKLWKEITHVNGLDFKQEDLTAFFNVIASAGSKKGCVLIQFPPGLRSTSLFQFRQLMESIRNIDSAREWKLAVEFRHSSWYAPEIYDLLNSYNACLVIQDMAKSKTPMTDHLCNHIYLRFHGPQGNYRGSYEDHFLGEFAGYVNEWLGEGKTVFAYFNNTMGDAFNNALFLKNAINGR